LKKARCQEEEKTKRNTTIRELPNLLPLPLHHSMTPMMKRRRRTPLLNHPQNLNGQRKRCLLRTLRKQGACSSSHHHQTTPLIPLRRSTHLLGREEDLKGESRELSMAHFLSQKSSNRYVMMSPMEGTHN
jgi:hypothetical protein